MTRPRGTWVFHPGSGGVSSTAEVAPTHLCNLLYFGGDDRWGFAFYTFSDDKCEPSIFPLGEFFGKPEEAPSIANAHARPQMSQVAITGI